MSDYTESPEGQAAMEQAEWDARTDVEGGVGGMLLRDWFAGQALTGLLADTAGRGTWPEIAQSAYVLADAMLKERVGQKEQG